MEFLRKRTPKNYSNIVILLIVTFISLYAFKEKKWEKEEIIVSDAISYYAYLPTIFIFHDITLDFLKTYKGDKKYCIWPQQTPTGGFVIKTSMGMSIMYMPFFFLGHAWAIIFNYNTGGYSVPYHFSIVLASFFYLFIGLYFLKKILVKFFSELITSITLFLVVLATNMFMYAAFENAMSHIYSFALFSIFIYLSIKLNENFSTRNTILAGLVLGLITLVRPTNIIIIIFLISYNIKSFTELKSRFLFYITEYKKVLLFLLSFILMGIPQLLYWKKVSGQFFYYSYGNENFFFLNPQIISGLFGYRNGWLIYAPIMAFAILGIIILYKSFKQFFIPVLLFLIFNTYIILSWYCWWYTGWGNRAFIDSYCIMAIPLAAFITWTFNQKRLLKIIVTLLMVMTAYLGWFYNYQYRSLAIHYCMMTKDAYWENFLKKSPTKKYWQKLREPDYDSANVGIQTYIDKRNNFMNILFNNERLSSNNAYLLSSNGNNFMDTLHTYSARTNEIAHSGQYSIKLNNLLKTAFTYSFDVYNNEEYEISVKRTHKTINCTLIASSADTSIHYYKETNQVVFSNPNDIWGTMRLYIYIPFSMHRAKLKIQVRNNTSNWVYFDDLTIRKINNR